MIPKKYQPKGFEILYEDRDIIVGNKAPGFLTVAAKWERVNTIHHALNQYVRKGQVKSHKRVYVVHRLDQTTSGVLIFAKTWKVQEFLKDNWANTVKVYYAIVHGKMPKKGGIISSYLAEDEDYVVHATGDKNKGKLARTEYKVLKETPQHSLLEINLITGRKNQIRVHLADEGHPVVGDDKYGPTNTKNQHLMLHASSISFLHPFSRKEVAFKAKIPQYFNNLINYDY